MKPAFDVAWPAVRARCAPGSGVVAARGSRGLAARGSRTLAARGSRTLAALESRTLAALGACVLVAGGARGQTTLHTFHGDAAGEQLGCAVAAAGDLDRDGFGDLLVGAWRAGDAGVDAGKARVFSGRDGSTLATWLGDSPGDHFGISVACAGDLDLDGWPDYAIGADHDGNQGLNSGSVRVISGRAGQVLFTLDGNGPQEDFGRVVRAAGDVDADGWPDLVVGAPHDDDQGVDSGSASVWSGRDGTRLHFFLGDAAGDHLGWSVAGAGDVDSDGHADVAVGAWGDDVVATDAGLVRVFSGATGALLHQWRGLAAGEGFGLCVARAGDVDGDQVPDLVVGADHAGAGAGLFPGAARIFSGASGALLREIQGAGTDELGFSVDGAGDWNGDGAADVVVGAWGSDENAVDSGSARVFSGSDGRLLLELRGSAAGDRLGCAVAGAGDTDGDGFLEVLVGCAYEDAHGANSGSARLVSHPVARPFAYCTAKANSLGCLPRIACAGVPSASAPSGFEVSAIQVLNHKPGLLLYGVSGRAAVPFQGGTLCVQPPLRRAAPVSSGGSAPPLADCSGRFALDLHAFAAGLLGGNPLPELRTPGTQVDCQWWGRDPGFAPPQSVQLSNALELVLGV